MCSWSAVENIENIVSPESGFLLARESGWRPYVYVCHKRALLSAHAWTGYSPSTRTRRTRRLYSINTQARTHGVRAVRRVRGHAAQLPDVDKAVDQHKQTAHEKAARAARARRAAARAVAGGRAATLRRHPRRRPLVLQHLHGAVLVGALEQEARNVDVVHHHAEVERARRRRRRHAELDRCEPAKAQRATRTPGRAPASRCAASRHRPPVAIL